MIIVIKRIIGRVIYNLIAKHMPLSYSRLSLVGRKVRAFCGKLILKECGKNVNIENAVYDGTVTGIINSSKKTGAFVEIEGKYITGLMPTDSMDIFNYKPGDHVKIKIKEFEVQEGKDAFIVNKKGVVIKCNTRPVFELA